MRMRLFSYNIRSIDNNNYYNFSYSGFFLFRSKKKKWKKDLKMLLIITTIKGRTQTWCWRTIWIVIDWPEYCFVICSWMTHRLLADQDRRHETIERTGIRYSASTGFSVAGLLAFTKSSFACRLSRSWA